MVKSTGRVAQGRQMRILHLVHQYLPEHVGGTELYTSWLAGALSQRGHDVAVFCRRSAEPKAFSQRTDENNVQVWTVTAGVITPHNRFLTTFGQGYILDVFRRVVTQSRPDLVHIQHLQGLPVALVREIQEWRIPFVITLHDYWWFCANAQLLTNYSRLICNGPQAHLNCARCAIARADQLLLWPALPALAGLLTYRNFLLGRVLRAAHQLIAPTDFVRDLYAAHGAPPERLQVIPHGLPLLRTNTRRTRQPANPIRFAYIGGLSWQKGVHVLLKAFEGLEKDAELWVAGDETADPAYASSLRQLAPSGVSFLGDLTRQKVWETLAQIDVLIVPSLWYETFVFVVSEAFAAGIPVVASRLGPLADRIHDGINGLLVPPNDSEILHQTLSHLIQHPDLLSQLGDGIGPVETIETHVTKLEAVYDTVLGEGS